MKKFDVIGIGNALLDLLIEVDDSVLDDLDLKKGEMCLTSENDSRVILEKVKNYDIKSCAGGSCANIVSGVGHLGGSCIFCGAVGYDDEGNDYEFSIVGSNVKTDLKRVDVSNTGHAITFITPDCQRTFATHLGAALELRKKDVNCDDIRNAKILHVEAYQIEAPELKEAVIYAMDVAKDCGTKISIDLSDPALIERNKDVIKYIVEKYADVVFANEDEARVFTGVDDEREALDLIYKNCDVAVVKLGSRGSLIKKDGEVYEIPSFKVDVVDTTGAGDMYAAGILYGLTNGLDIKEAGEIASKKAAEVVSRIGARLD